jgi:acylphosphatase
MTAHRTIRITGVVQGVSFRAYAADEARRLGLTGWVRNEADGSVLIEAEGDEAPLDRLVAWCGVGPPAARVEGVDVQAGPPVGHAEFQLRH